MNKPNAPGSPSVYHAEPGPPPAVHSPIHEEAPVVYSAEQMGHRAAALREALTARGLQVRETEVFDDLHEVTVVNTVTRAHAVVSLYDRGGASWEVVGDAPDGMPLTRIVDRIADTLT